MTAVVLEIKSRVLRNLRYHVGLWPLSPRGNDNDDDDDAFVPDSGSACCTSSPSVGKYSSFLTSTGLSSTGEGSSFCRPETSLRRAILEFWL